MSIVDSVRRALLLAAIPLLAKDIRDLCDEDITAQQTSTALNQLAAAGEVEIDRDARPFTYVRTSTLVDPGKGPGMSKDSTAVAPVPDAAARVSAQKQPAAAPASPVPPLGATVQASAYGAPNSTPDATHIEIVAKNEQRPGSPLGELTEADIDALARRVIASLHGVQMDAQQPGPQLKRADAVARHAAGLMMSHWPDAQMPTPIRQFVIEALGGAA